MIKSEYHIAKMDCPSEETLIRMKLEDIQEIAKLDFDLQNRSLTVYHDKENPAIIKRLDELNLSSKFIKSGVIDMPEVISDSSVIQSRLLWTVLIINFGFFLIELSTGFISNSMGLVADSLDMLADAFVYGLSLWAIGSVTKRKKSVARISGYIQLSLAILGLTEVVRRFISTGSMPDYRIMIVVSILALIANSVCLYLLQKSRSDEAHMRASMIFTSNDIIINSGVIAAGLLVLLTGSKYPDLIVGSMVFIIVVRGAIRILKLGN